MNVNDAMETAWQFGEQESKDMLFAEHIAILLATEIERLRAELAAAKANSEALKKALYSLQEAAIRLGDRLDDAEKELAEAKAENVGLEEGDRLAAEVERLRIWNKRWRDVSAKLRLTVAHLSEELAAAKAASACPVKFYWCYQSNECDILIHGMNDEDSTRFGNWLDDRMKERDEK